MPYGENRLPARIWPSECVPAIILSIYAAGFYAAMPLCCRSLDAFAVVTQCRALTRLLLSLDAAA